MHIDVWSDIVCPFCYIGKRHLEAALATFEHRDQVKVVWHSFELDPEAPKSDQRSQVEILMSKYGQSREQIDTMMARVIEMGTAAGLNLRLNNTIRVNSLLAHRLLHLAAGHQLQSEAKERLMQAYFSEGEDLSDGETLVRLLEEIGMPAEPMRATIASETHTTTVRADEMEAHEMGVSGVPFFVFDRTFAVSGAQPPAVFSQALAKAWEARSAEVPEAEAMDASSEADKKTDADLEHAKPGFRPE